MAHYAKIGLDNIVENVVVVADADTSTSGGIEKESIGVAFLTSNTGHSVWKKCSYNTEDGMHHQGGTPYRANFPSIGWTYNSEHDIFVEPRPEDKDGESCNSWTLNTTTGRYDAPLTKPDHTQDMSNNGEIWVWDESAYQADNTQGWTKSS